MDRNYHDGHYQQLPGHGGGGRQGRGIHARGYPAEGLDAFALDQEIQQNHPENYHNVGNNDLKQPLLIGHPSGAADAEQKSEKDNNEENKSGCWYRIQRCMGWTVSKEKRHINFDGSTRPRRFPSNKLNNQKYSCITFLPLLLYNEFKFFFNMFFLLIALTQFIPFLKVGLLVTYVAPLGIVLLITCFKEAYDDL